ncbi:MAG TPA: isopentenyl-diphosphate Delta-isomerase [Longimicrobiales bacterium]|nr:isopentenyl-diphosphate Delta-isomerase [Longimicrobiales bacterium]
MSEHVILVDRDDVALGTLEKLDAHVDGALHRAFSVFVFDGSGRMMLQRRAASKYHSGGLWSNTCCSHPRPGEATVAAARRRLQEEMGFDCGLEQAFSFVYRADVGGGLIEHEFDHVFVGRFDGMASPDPGEVDAWRWASPETVARQLVSEPGRYTYWFRVAFDELRRRGYLEPSARDRLLENPHGHHQLQPGDRTDPQDIRAAG